MRNNGFKAVFSNVIEYVGQLGISKGGFRFKVYHIATGCTSDKSFARRLLYVSTSVTRKARMRDVLSIRPRNLSANDGG
jgi:hypothetical protein